MLRFLISLLVIAIAIVVYRVTTRRAQSLPPVSRGGQQPGGPSGADEPRERPRNQS